MHEKWMLEMRIYRLKKRLHHLNRRLYERSIYPKAGGTPYLLLFNIKPE